MTDKEYNICVKEWSHNLYRFALKNIGDAVEAQDIVQQSFETLWIHKDQVPIEKGKSYLFTITYRRSMDYFRRNKKIETNTITFPQEVSLNQYQQYEWKEYLQKALEALDEQSRTLILLKDLEGYKYEEIADITDLTTEQVRVYLHRARKKLKNILQPAITTK